MSKVISFINRKGGTAKTTCAINVAIVLKRMGNQVVVIETDNNCRLGRLREMEVTDGENEAARSILFPANRNQVKGFPEIIQVAQESASPLIDALRMKMIDIIIVDGAANMAPEVLRSIAGNSDIIVLPTSDSAEEIDVTEMTLQDIAPVRRQRPGLKVVILANRIHFLTSPETVQKKFSRLDAPLLDVYIPHFNLYKYLSTVTPVGSYKKVTNRLQKLLSEEGKAVERPRALTV